MDNLEYWNKLKQPPKTALKTIGGGRLKGMTDIKPQWRIQVMTEVFGPCGEGWMYTIEKLWTEPGANGEVIAFALVNLWVKTGGNNHAPIPGIGGSMLIAKEKNGLYSSDEAYKMAVTDALSVAMKALGVGADVYLGNWNGSKYMDEPAQKQLPKSPNINAQRQRAIDMIKASGHDIIQAQADYNKAKEAGACDEALDILQGHIDSLTDNGGQ